MKQEIGNRPRTSRRGKLDFSMKMNLALLAAFTLLIAWGIFLVRDKLLRNADEMGTYLAESYATEEENRASMYRLFMRLGSIYMDERIHQNASVEEVQQWLAEYSSHLSTALGAAIIDPYAVMDGEIIAADPWPGDGTYDYAQTQWYQKALEAGGDIIFTDAYTDVITGKQLITMAQELERPGDVLAFDILLENFHTHKNKASMPEGSTYFLFDGNGELIYTTGQLDVSQEKAGAYIQTLLSGIQDGSLDSHEATILDLDGKQRGVYYDEMDNGWLSVITIPIQNILQSDLDGVIVTLAVICLALMITVAAALLRSYFGEQKMRHTADTLQILGDTFYAIYRINYETGTYETIKSSRDVREQLGRSGTYRHLLDVLRGYVEEQTYQEFEHSFSMENIRRLVAHQIYEYGGDYQRKFGDTYKWVSIKIIYNKALGLNEVIMCFREIDVEKRKQLQQHLLLENALNTAKQTAKKKNTFFSSVSHDMRTPLNAVIGLADLARKNRGNEEKVDEYLAKIEQAGRQLLTLVNDVLDMSRIEHGEGGTLNYAPMDLRRCVEDCAALFREQAAQEKKTLAVKADVERQAVYCDTFRMNQILNNLISNALKYSLEGARITVELKLTSRQGKLCRYQIVVSDTGIGMSEEFLEKIFEPFARETLFSPTKVTGTGLGMPIVKSLVQQMSGEITVQSRLGEGSVFTVTLPLQLAEEGALSHGEPQPDEDFDLTGRRILVAEDNEINMEITSECLSMLGAEVLPAWNGREAVELFSSLEEGSIDVILMDMQMPEMDGCEACRAIRAMNRKDARTVPIIAVTANAFAEDVARTTQAGMDGHISKPIDFEQLKELLKQKLTQRTD